MTRKRAVPCGEPSCGRSTTSDDGRCPYHPVTAAATSRVSLPAVAVAEEEPRRYRPNLVPLSPSVKRLLDAATRAGARPYLVGGCVRDALLGAVPKDVDIELHNVADVDLLTRALARVGTVNEVGKSFGVLKVTVGGEEIDVALPRRDSKTGPGHRGFAAEVDPSITTREASSRRDFTFNAVMYDVTTEEVVDWWGGEADLEARVLRHVSPAFTEDPLRVLRAVQFASRFDLTVADDTAVLCRSISNTFDELPRERVWGEVEKIARGHHITRAVVALEATGWIEHFPELASCRGVPQDPSWHPEGDVLVHLGQSGDSAAAIADEAGLSGDDRTVVVLGALLHDVGKVTHTQLREDGRITSHGHDHAGVEPAARLLARVGAPNNVTSRILPIIREHMCSVKGDPSPPAVRRLARRLAPATVAEWSYVVEADKSGRGSASTRGTTSRWTELAATAGVTHAPTRPYLDGGELIALGHRPGPEFRPVMEASIEAQDEGVFADRAGATTWLHTLHASGELDRLLELGRQQHAEERAETARVRAAERAAAKAARSAGATG